MGTPITSSLREKRLRCSSQAVGGLTATRERASPSPPWEGPWGMGMLPKACPGWSHDGFWDATQQGEEESAEGRRHGAVDVLVGMHKETATALCPTGEGVNLSSAGQPFLTTSALHRHILQSWRTDPAASELSLTLLSIAQVLDGLEEARRVG